MIADDGEPVLIDFGLSRNRYETTRTLTQLERGGSLRFLTPELPDPDGTEEFRSTEATDIYALGITFLHLDRDPLP